MIPDLDRPLQELLEISLDKARANITITVPLLQNMSISVRWRAVIDDDLVKEFSSYLVPESSSRDVNTTVPNFVLIGKVSFSLLLNQSVLLIIESRKHYAYISYRHIGSSHVCRLSQRSSAI